MKENAPWDGLIWIGDVLNMDCVSSHNTGKLRNVEGQRLIEDYRIADEVILKPAEKIIRDANPDARICWIQGNHEARCEKWLEFNPSATGLIEPQIVLKLKERRIEWIPYWQDGTLLKIGKATFIHGRYTNQHHPLKHAIRYGSSVFYGHCHDVASCGLEQYGQDSTIVAQSLGCLCQPMPYMNGSPDKWQQAFAVFEFMPGGDFGYSVIRITNHRFVFGGKIYEA